MDETNPSTGAFVDFPANQPPRPVHPTPEQVAGRDGGDVKREADERRAREIANRTIPITERGSTARVPPSPEQLARGRELLARGRAPIKDVVRNPEELMRANLEAPGHQIGDAIEGDIVRADCGLFQCGIDALGRVWRVEDGGEGKRLVLAGWLNT
jgi:hypothetical protein